MKELDRIESLADEASEGPWYVDDEEHTVRAKYYNGEIIYDRSCEDHYNWFETFRADAAFISEMRTSVPRLVAALRAVLALRHEDYCCTLGCPGGGWCGLPMDQFCDATRCSCFMAGPIRAIAAALGEDADALVHSGQSAALPIPTPELNFDATF